MRQHAPRFRRLAFQSRPQQLLCLEVFTIQSQLSEINILLQHFYTKGNAVVFLQSVCLISRVEPTNLRSAQQILLVSLG